MIHAHKVISISFKHFLFLVAMVFAIAATLLLILFTSAATTTGSNPSLAISLASETNTGILGPGQQRWFRIVPSQQDQAISIEKSLTLKFASTNNNLSQYVALQLFEENQIQFFQANSNSQMVNFGVGQIVSNDDDPETSELFWTGLVFSDKTYYIQLINDSDFPLDYWLFTKDVNNVTIVPDNNEAAIETSVPAAVSEAGTDPGNPASIMSNVTTGHLKPGTTYWYAFTQFDPANDSQFQNLDFSLFFTPDNGNRRHNVNFEIFSANEVDSWWRGNHNTLVNFGAGMLVSRDGDTNTGERIWRGTLLKNDTYFLTVHNGTGVEIDYWLFNDDVITPELGSKPALEPAPVFAQGAAPQTAHALDAKLNTGGLEPGQEIWYNFSIADYDNEVFEEMALTMIATPDDGNRIRYVTFDVFTAEGVHTWSPGNTEAINNVGTGSVVYRDNNPLTGERFWSGWVVDNDLYYVRIRNGSAIHIDYWLFNGDVYQPELE